MTEELIVHDAGHTWWLCGNCGRKLGEVIGQRVVIRAGSVMLSVALHAEPEQTCPRCGTTSALREEVAA